MSTEKIALRAVVSHDLLPLTPDLTIPLEEVDRAGVLCFGVMLISADSQP